MVLIDWLIVAFYVVAAVVIGMLFTKKASESTADFFVAGRSLPWYIAGTSMVATTFSSDTPLFVAGAVREQGIYANWIWWVSVIGVIISVFFFANLWRRSKALTEIELISQRYDKSKATDFLRIFKAIFDGVFVNCIIIASVTLAMSKIIVVILGLSAEPLFEIPLFGPITATTLILIVLAIAAVVYTAMSGLYGVVYTDLIQFALAIVGSVVLAIIVYVDLQDHGGIVAAVEASPGFNSDTLKMIPDFEWDLKTATFVILVCIGWLNYAPGFGFFLQRTLAARSEKDAMLSLYWFAFCHLVLRSWPWIIVGVASLVYFPSLVDAEQSYPMMIDEFLPVGLKGIMVASLLAAFMSTLDTQLNWGSSYLVNDVYEPYLVKGREKAHYIKAARISMLALTLVALIVTTQLESILGAYEYISVIIIPISVVLIARWYWWRINVWSEISALITAVIVGNAMMYILPDEGEAKWFAVRMLATTMTTLVVCLVVTLMTSSKTPSPKTIEFYSRLKIHGRGWKKVRDLTGIEPIAAGIKDNAIACVASIAFIYSLLLGIGNALFEDWQTFGYYLIVIVASGWVVKRKMPKVIASLRQEV
ncbi:sodium:solute symporter family protein [Pseudoalteromonas sp. CH_XMU1449-3]|uniref:sodium:solute symporter family protein n=1 Tax=Pseudoalteromonas sp. CH_XMU1449-3 TaxID=3107774 RepID=UPI00300A0202